MSALSVCCLTNDRPAAVAAALAPFRPVADEILVALDSSVDPSRSGPLLEVADTVVRYEYPGTPERARPWLVAACRNPTVLMVDGDEVPSVALVGALPALLADDAVLQYRIARRWLYPDPRTWLAERPWWPDFQRRLVRRGADLDFDLRFHGGVRDAVPARYVMEPLYHLACVARTVTDRRQAARRYEAERPGLVAVGGGPMNDTLYVPEHFATRRPASTPEEDVAAIRAVLDAAEAPPVAAELPLVTASEIARHAPEDPIEDQGYRVQLRVVDQDMRTEPGNDTHVVVAVTNTGSAPLCHRDVPGARLRVATLVRDTAGASLVPWWARTELPCDIAPGETRVVEAIVHIPDRPQRCTVEIDMLNEHGRWFGAAVTAPFTVATRWGSYAL